MKKSKFSETEIVSILKQGDAGVPVKDLCRKAGISSATYYQWKSKYGSLDASVLKRVKELEKRLGVTWEPIITPQPEYGNKSAALIAGGTMPDLFYLNPDRTPRPSSRRWTRARS